MGLQNLNLPRNSVKSVISENVIYLELLKNWISELEKQLTEKNTIITNLTAILVTKPEETSVNYNLCKHDHQKVNSNKANRSIL